MLVHAYQNHVKGHLDLFLTDSSIELQRLLKRVTTELQSDIPENDTRYGGLTLAFNKL